MYPQVLFSMKRSTGPFLGGPGTRALILAAIASASVALTLTTGVWSFKPYDPAAARTRLPNGL